MYHPERLENIPSFEIFRRGVQQDSILLKLAGADINLIYNSINCSRTRVEKELQEAEELVFERNHENSPVREHLERLEKLNDGRILWNHISLFSFGINIPDQQKEACHNFIKSRIREIVTRLDKKTAAGNFGRESTDILRALLFALKNDFVREADVQQCVDAIERYVLQEALSKAGKAGRISEFTKYRKKLSQLIKYYSIPEYMNPDSFTQCCTSISHVVAKEINSMNVKDMSSEPEFNELEHSLEDLQISGSLDKASYTRLIKKLISRRLKNILDNINMILKSKGKTKKKNLGRWARELRTIRNTTTRWELLSGAEQQDCMVALTKVKEAGTQPDRNVHFQNRASIEPL